jgi:ABC-2 type transport system permease protein
MTRFWQVARAVAWRSIHKIATTPALLLPSVVFPLFFFVAFAGGLSNVGNVPGFEAEFPSGYTAFQFVFVLIQASAFGGVFTGFGIASDFENGFARRLLLAAPNRYGIIAGYAIAAAARTTFVGALIFVIGLLTGMQVGGSGVDIAALVLLSYLVSLSATLFAAGVAMRLRTMQAGPLMQMPVFLVLFLAPVYVPLGLLSGWVHAVATVNPITPIIETGRDFISGTPGPIGLAYAIGAALVVLFAWWAARGLRSAEAAGGG